MLISKTTFLKKVNLNLRPVAMLLLLVFVLYSCNTSNVKTVSITTEYLPNYTWGLINQLIWIDDTLMIASLENNGMKFYNTDSYQIDSIQIDNMPTKIKRMDVVDFKSFAFSTEDSIFIYDNGCLERVCPRLPHNVILATHDLFAFFPQKQKIIFQVVDYRDIENELYGNNYLFEYDYLGTTTPVELKYGQEYNSFNLGQPRIHYSKFSDGLVVGLEYSKEVSKLTFSKEKIEVETTTLGGSFEAKRLYEAQTDELTDKLDNMFMRLHYSGYFTNVFYSEEEDKIIRIYDYPIPDKAVNGAYLTRDDKKKGFLVEGQKQIQHFLPSQRYYSVGNWYLHNETYYYLKSSRLDNGQVSYMLEKIKLHPY
jgi:hypothetical protein